MMDERPANPAAAFTPWSSLIDLLGSMDAPDLVQVLGYRRAFDGGHGLWAFCLGGGPGPGMRRLGERWFRLLVPPLLDPRALGAAGEGEGNDTLALQEALDCSAAVQLSPGRYAVRNLEMRRAGRLAGVPGAVLCPADRQDGTEANVLLRICGDGCEVRGIDFEGVVSRDASRLPAPFALLLASRRAVGFEAVAMGDDTTAIAYQPIADLHVAQCRFTGAQWACVATMVDDATFEDLTITEPLVWGLAVWAGGRRVMMRGIRVRGAGLNEGIKLGYRGSTRIAKDIILTDFMVADCGWLNPDPADAQEGVDLLLGSARKVVIANGTIDNCGAGGLELKTRRTAHTPDVYQDIVIANVVIRNTVAAKGIVLNWTPPYGAADPSRDSDDKAGRVLITGCRVSFELSHDPRPGTSAAGVRIVGWSDVAVVGVDVVGGAVGFAISADAGNAGATRRVSLMSCRTSGVEFGVYLPKGRVEELSLTGCELNAWSAVLAATGAAVQGMRVTGCRMRQRAAGRAGARGTALDLRRVQDAIIADCVLEADTAVLHSVADQSIEPASRNNALVGCTLVMPAGTRPMIRLQEGTGWRILGGTRHSPDPRPLVEAAFGVEWAADESRAWSFPPASP